MANEIQNIQPAQPQGEIILYQPDETVRLEVRLEDETTHRGKHLRHDERRGATPSAPHGPDAAPLGRDVERGVETDCCIIKTKKGIGNEIQGFRANHLQRAHESLCGSLWRRHPQSDDAL